MSGRKHRVSVEGELSCWANVKSGIPQGSVLGPILFVIFINDMPNTIRSFCQLFADDAKIFRNIKSPSDSDCLQEDIDKLSGRFDGNCPSMKANAKACILDIRMNGGNIK